MHRVLLAGGGTAGHVNPALAIAEIIKEKYPDTEFCFAGNPDKIEARLVEKAGYRFEPVRIEGFQRHISAENIKRNFKAVGYLMKSGIPVFCKADSAAQPHYKTHRAISVG